MIQASAVPEPNPRANAPFRPTLGQLFVGTILGIGALMCVLFYLLLSGTRESIIKSSDKIRDQASRDIGFRVKAALEPARAAILDIERQFKHSIISVGDWPGVEKALYSRLLENENLAEVTLTYGSKTGFQDGLIDGEIQLAPNGRGQVSVFRVLDPAGNRILVQRTSQDGALNFVTESHERQAGGNVVAPPPKAESAKAPADPTQHDTFTTPANQTFYGQLLWSDLHWTQLDAQLPEAQRRVVVTAQKAIEDGTGHFIGVLRAGMLTEQLDRIVQLKLTEHGGVDPHRVFICGKDGLLITRWTPQDKIHVGSDLGGGNPLLSGEELMRARVEYLRFSPNEPYDEYFAALRTPAWAAVTNDSPYQTARFESGGRTYLVSFRALDEMQDWVIGVLVPEEAYLGGLLETRNRLLAGAAIVMAFIVIGGLLTLRTVRRDLARITRETGRMRGFDFQPADTRATLRDVQSVADGLERAKTAMRVMSKYAPVSLVRQLYEQSEEPKLGGELREVTLLFSDIEGFTTLAENLTPNDLAVMLGHYLEAMAVGIHAGNGVIDKYIGDSVMAFWNAPLPCEGHAHRACEAALECQKRTDALYKSVNWRGLPPLFTRIGIHKDTVMVGHFGAPDRMNYTALGDGVNIASRLEGLNKAYGTKILVSETVYEDAKDAFAWRLLDFVAVKGRNKGLKVYELLGTRSHDGSVPPAVAEYERAFTLYLNRDFAAALAAVETQEADAPSQALATRCREMLKSPPPADWNGIYHSTSK